MGVGVVFGRLPGVVCRVEPVAVGDVRVMGGLFMMAFVVRLRGFPMVYTKPNHSWTTTAFAC